MPQTNCPFYGHALMMRVIGGDDAVPFRLLNSRGNQCGLIIHAHSPCRMEIAGQEVDWRSCPVVAEIRVALDADT